MPIILHALSAAAAVYSVFQLAEDGPYGEIEAGLAAVCFCVLLSAGSIVREMRRGKQ